MNPDKPHDKFFKETFSRTDIAGDFLQAYLPESVRSGLDISSLQRDVDSYVDEELSEHFADLVFSGTFGKESVIRIFTTISTEAGTIAMSAAQKLINEGIEQGIEKGIEQGIEKGIRGMLKLGMNTSTIAAAFEMPQEQVELLIKKIKRETR